MLYNCNVTSATVHLLDSLVWLNIEISGLKFQREGLSNQHLLVIDRYINLQLIFNN